MSIKNLYIIAGCNGAEKTTASYTILPDIIDCHEFVNADEIAKGLSPFRPESVSIEAGRIMIHRIEELLFRNTTFAFETTLASKTYKHKILEAQQNGYIVTLLFFWLHDAELAKERVKIRVSEGGHNINEDIIERRYTRGIVNLFNVYLDIVNTTLIFNNTFGKPELIARKSFGNDIEIINQDSFTNLKLYYERS